MEKKEQVSPEKDRIQMNPGAEIKLLDNLVDQLQKLEMRDESGKIIELKSGQNIKTYIDEHGNFNIYQDLKGEERAETKIDPKKTKMLLETTVEQFKKEFDVTDSQEREEFLDALGHLQVSFDDEWEGLRDRMEEEKNPEKKEVIKKEMELAKKSRDSAALIINALETNNFENVTKEEFRTVGKEMSHFITIPMEQVKKAYEKMSDEQKKAYLGGFDDAVNASEKIILGYKEVLESEDIKIEEKKEAQRAIEEERQLIKNYKKFLDKFTK
ncbi:hypothetical protein KJ885_00335 [Patescibacteria group bacterium]|nr:hypothetical protein [Patescibacteria group bacterium]